MDTGRPSGHARLLIKAAEILGGEYALRAFLQAPPKEFERWMEGKSMLPANLFLKLADLLSAHTEDFVTRVRARQDQLQERLKRSAESIEAGRATLARSAYARNWSIVLRSTRLRERDTGTTSQLKHRLFAPSFVPTDRADLLEAALDATLAAAGNDLGNVQLVDADGSLHIEAHRGFQEPFLEFFAVVSKAEGAGGIAISLGRQVFIPDVRRNSMFMGTNAGKALESAGCAAVTSTPLVHDSGLVMGMISTHYRKPCAEHEAALPSLELIARRAASWLETSRAFG